MLRCNTTFHWLHLAPFSSRWRTQLICRHAAASKKQQSKKNSLINAGSTPLRYRKTMTVNLSGLVRCFCANTNRCNVRGHLLELPTRSCNKTTYLRLAGDAWQRRSIARKQLDKNSQHGGGTRHKTGISMSSYLGSVRACRCPFTDH